MCKEMNEELLKSPRRVTIRESVVSRQATRLKHSLITGQDFVSLRILAFDLNTNSHYFKKETDSHDQTTTFSPAHLVITCAGKKRINVEVARKRLLLILSNRVIPPRQRGYIFFVSWRKHVLFVLCFARKTPGQFVRKTEMLCAQAKSQVVHVLTGATKNRSQAISP